MKNILFIFLALVGYLLLLFSVVHANDGGTRTEVTDLKLLKLYEIAIENSYVQLDNPPTLMITTDSSGEAYFDPNNNVIVLYSNYNWTDRYKNVSLNDLTSNDALETLSVLGHEYGHAIQKKEGISPNEVQAQTFSSYVLLKIGFTKQRLIDFYNKAAIILKNGNMCDQSNIGHPDACGEELQNAENVNHVDELLSEAVS